ncbi:MAG: hypothetical protein AAFP81_17065 [Pseudomonadota bacterium]
MEETVLSMDAINLDATSQLVHYSLKLHGKTQPAYAKHLGFPLVRVQELLKRKTTNPFNEYDRFKEALYTIWTDLKSSSPHPEYMRSVFEALFKPFSAADLLPKEEPDEEEEERSWAIKDKRIRDRFSGFAEDLADANDVQSRYAKLQGLCFLIRPSNETIEVEDDNGDPKYVSATSISVVNLVPEQTEKGKHHPLFKLYQESEEGIRLTVEGNVLVRKDRIILSGRDRDFKRLAVLSFPVGEDDSEEFRSDDHAPKTLMGVMLGLSTKKSQFIAPFILVAVPLLSVKEARDHAASSEADDDETAQFKATDAIARKVAGVYPDDKAAEQLAESGIKNLDEDIAELLRRARRFRTISVG